MTYDELMRELNQKKYRPVYLLQGDEPYFIDKIADFIEHNVLPEADRAFNQSVLYGKETDPDTIIATAYRYPMMSPYQVVIVKEAHNLKDIGRLQGYVEKAMPSTILVIINKGKAVASNTKLYKAIDAKGLIFSAAKLPESQIATWVQKYLAAQKRSIAPEAAALIAEHAGNDLQPIANELDKLMLLVPIGETITAQHIEDNLGISKDYNLFELQKALAKRNSTKAHEIAHYFASHPKDAPLVVVIGSLYRFFSRLYIFHHQAGKPDTEIAQAMNMKNAYFLNEYRDAAKKYNLPQTQRVIHLLHQYDLKSKGVDCSTDPTQLMKEMTYRILNVP